MAAMWWSVSGTMGVRLLIWSAGTAIMSDVIPLAARSRGEVSSYICSKYGV